MDRFRTIVNKALKIEQNMYEMYIRMMEETKDLNSHKLFRSLAIQELRHEALLKEVLKLGSFPDAKRKIYSRYDDSFDLTNSIHHSAEMGTMRECLRLAIDVEHKQYLYYKGLSEKAEEMVEEDLFYFLSKEERRHEIMLEGEYKRMFSVK